MKTDTTTIMGDDTLLKIVPFTQLKEFSSFVLFYLSYFVIFGFFEHFDVVSKVSLSKSPVFFNAEIVDQGSAAWYDEKIDGGGVGILD